MENASKALLIAASILIVILLIAIGMRVFNSTSGTTDSVEVTMNATEKATFNAKFTAYIGKKSSAQVKTLANLIIASNKLANTPQEISLIINGTNCTNLQAVDVKLNHLGKSTFNVDITAYTNGLISEITVS